MTVVQLAKQEPDAGLVEVLREMLAEAEAGELVGLCAVCEYRAADAETVVWPCDAYHANWCLDQLKLELFEQAEDD